MAIFKDSLEALLFHPRKDEEIALKRVVDDEVKKHYEKSLTKKTLGRIRMTAIKTSIPIALGATLGYMVCGAETATTTAEVAASLCIPLRSLGVLVGTITDAKRRYSLKELQESSHETYDKALNNGYGNVSLTIGNVIAAASLVAAYSGAAWLFEKATGQPVNYSIVNATALGSLALNTIISFGKRYQMRSQIKKFIGQNPRYMESERAKDKEKEAEQERMAEERRTFRFNPIIQTH